MNISIFWKKIRGIILRILLLQFVSILVFGPIVYRNLNQALVAIAIEEEKERLGIHNEKKDYTKDIMEACAKKTFKDAVNIITFGFVNLPDDLSDKTNSLNKYLVPSISKDSNTEENFKDRND